jgi:UDP-N-acetylmuramoyl-tripeptide--D-alanyl-D-alanine ligase
VHGKVRQHGLETALELSAAEGEAAIRLLVPGRHNARNAVAAAAACLAAGVPLSAVVAGLEDFAGVKGRLQRRAGNKGAELLDDTYNANPDSVRAGIDVLAATIGRKLLVLGDMGEIGEASGQYHDEIGGYAKSQGIDRLFALGDAVQQAVRNFGEGARHFCNIEKLIAAVDKELGPETTVLIKGSRFMKMERVADALAAPVVPEEKN